MRPLHVTFLAGVSVVLVAIVLSECAFEPVIGPVWWRDVYRLETSHFDTFHKKNIFNDHSGNPCGNHPCSIRVEDGIPMISVTVDLRRYPLGMNLKNFLLSAQISATLEFTPFPERINSSVYLLLDLNGSTLETSGAYVPSGMLLSVSNGSLRQGADPFVVNGGIRLKHITFISHDKSDFRSSGCVWYYNVTRADGKVSEFQLITDYTAFEIYLLTVGMYLLLIAPVLTAFFTIIKRDFWFFVLTILLFLLAGNVYLIA